MPSESSQINFCRLRDQLRSLHPRILPVSIPNFLCMLFEVALQGCFLILQLFVKKPLFSEHTHSILIASSERSNCKQGLLRSKYLILLNFLIVRSLHDACPPGCYVASNDLQSAVACSIASSHEDLHEVTSISSCADLNSQSVFPNTGSQGTDLCLEF